MIFKKFGIDASCFKICFNKPDIGEDTTGLWCLRVLSKGCDCSSNLQDLCIQGIIHWFLQHKVLILQEKNNDGDVAVFHLLP